MRATPLPPPKERRRLREAKGLTEEQVASALGVARVTLRSWEMGRTNPQGRRREVYARFLAAIGEEAPTAPRAPGMPPCPPGALRAPAAPGVRSGTTARPVDARAAAVVGRTPARSGPAVRHTPAPARVPWDVPDMVPPAPPRFPDATPGEAFDALYSYTAPALVRQTYLLTGRRRLALEAVERAFHLAWQRWPEVAVDFDPAGWVRATAYEYAMSPWHRMRRAHRHPDRPPVTEPARQPLLAALQELPPSYRRTLLLYDGLGLGLPETAAETEASTPAAVNRLLHAREAVAERVPELGEPELLREELKALANDVPVPRLAPARTVRANCERRAQVWTRVAVVATTLIVAATALTLFTAPRHYEPPVPRGERVEGVPEPHNGPQRLSKRDQQLRDKLRAEPAHGPNRMAPQLR
ncbi:sigma factor-like helix-turn-helix DNA-binding protein [Streptomyces sp. NPDC002889]|uniref:sigma factor-like helix-turn-helix DNA-binding protein n=1 Tax=Streptomyces sp. NPDC002889 TaxID=3364669 RepID=UPI0036CD5E32